ncbi:MAG: hypothetical protein AAGG01_02380, partial [Planctomycetota bacterium]
AGSNAVIQEVLRTLGRSHAFGLAPVQTAVFEEDTTTPLAQEDEVESEPAIFGFLEDQPLRGTIVGENFSIALIGKQRVRLGEIVPGTAAKVTEIHRGRVVLVEAGMTIEVELAPLETSEALMRARAAAQVSGGANAAAADSSADGLPTGDAPSEPGNTGGGANARPQSDGVGGSENETPQGDF